MLVKLIKSYYNFFDTKIEHWTTVIFIISLLILSVWITFSSQDTLSYSKASLYESKSFIKKSSQTIPTENIITISWVQYKIVLEKLD